MDHKNCRHLLGSLSGYLDGDLGEELCAEIDRHLVDCDDCQIVVDSLRKTISLYQETAKQGKQVPDDVRQRLHHRLDLDEYIGKENQ